MLGDLFAWIREWFSILTTPPQTWLWTLAFPGLTRSLKRFRNAPHIGPYIAAFLDSSASVWCERGAWVLLLVFILAAVVLAPLSVMSRQRQHFAIEKAALQARIAELENLDARAAERAKGELRNRALVLGAELSRYIDRTVKPWADHKAREEKRLSDPSQAAGHDEARQWLSKFAAPMMLGFDVIYDPARRLLDEAKPFGVDTAGADRALEAAKNPSPHRMTTLDEVNAFALELRALTAQLERRPARPSPR